jgi:uncharacterized protein DUF5615
MQVRLYFDEDTMDGDVVSALRVRGVDTMTAHDSALINSSDERQLEYAAANERVLYSFNVSDYMALHVAYMSAGKHHAGLILAQQQRYSVGEQMRRLLRVVQMKPAEGMRDSVEFLSAWG